MGMTVIVSVEFGAVRVEHSPFDYLGAREEDAD